MNNFIITTTINKTTTALKKYSNLKNWKLIADNVEIILYGNSEGIENAANELNVKIVKNIK